MTDITVPTLGESVTEATVGQWLKSAGDSVKKDEVIVELETDKVSVEVAAPEDGVLSEIVAGEGDTVEIGALLGKVSAGGEAAPAKAEAAPKEEAAKEETAKPAESSSSSGDTIEVSVPAMGESVSEGTLSSWLKKPGDKVAKDETIVEIETDKVAVEVPSPVDGVLGEILVQEGETVEIGTVIARISGGSGGAAAPAPAPAKAASAPAPSQSASSTGSPSGDAPVSPAVRRIAAENSINPSNIPGTGKDGRATKGDALSYLEKKPMEKSSAPTASVTPRADGPREERVKMTRLRQTIARRLKEAQENAAMLTTFNDVDMTNIMEMRKKYKDSFEKRHGVKLGFMSFFVKAVVNALQEIPAVNAEIDGTDVIYKNYYDIGVAVGTEKGLVVPVVRDCDQLTLAGIESGIADYGRKARDGQLSMADMQGGTFTISNGGVYGSMMSTPILNPPQSGVLGMHRIEDRPIAMNGQVVIRPMMYLALSYDHRIVDGKEAVTFLVRVKEALENPERMLLGV